MNYRDFSSTDFAADAFFQRWVQNPDIDTIFFWEQWIDQNPEKNQVIQEAKKLVATIHFEEKEYKEEFINKIWRNIEEGIAVQNPVLPINDPKQKLSTRFFNYYKGVAAGLIFLVLAAAVLYKLFVPTVITQTTAYGEIKTILLPDSSLITLNSNSKLQYHKGWDNRKEREVWLEGEGFFQVRKKPAPSPAKPCVKFIVHVNLMDVEVLGTQFNVNTRRNKAQVVLQSGKVKLSSNKETNPESVMMMPGELVERTPDQSGFIKKVVDPKLYSSWKNQQFIFNSTPLAEIAAVLEDTYGWQVIVPDKDIAQMTFTSTVPVKKPEVLLRLLEEAFHVNIQKKGDKVVIRK